MSCLTWLIIVLRMRRGYCLKTIAFSIDIIHLKVFVLVSICLKVVVLTELRSLYSQKPDYNVSQKKETFWNSSSKQKHR